MYLGKAAPSRTLKYIGIEESELEVCENFIDLKDFELWELNNYKA